MMFDNILHTWHCEDCEERFYTEAGIQPEFCPFCRSLHLFKSKWIKWQ